MTTWMFVQFHVPAGQGMAGLARWPDGPFWIRQIDQRGERVQAWLPEEAGRSPEQAVRAVWPGATLVVPMIRGAHEVAFDAERPRPFWWPPEPVAMLHDTHRAVQDEASGRWLARWSGVAAKIVWTDSLTGAEMMTLSKARSVAHALAGQGVAASVRVVRTQTRRSVQIEQPAPAHA